MYIKFGNVINIFSAYNFITNTKYACLWLV